MKTTCLNFLMIISSICWGQETPKDSLFLSNDHGYMRVSVNYENNHFFVIVKETIVTSAFKGTPEERMSYFTQIDRESVLHLHQVPVAKTHDIKEYLYKNGQVLRDSLSQKFDAYKLMRYFHKFHVFIKKEAIYIPVDYTTTLSE